LRNVGLLTAATLLLARGRTHGSMDSGPWTAFFALDRVINVSGTIIVAGLLSGTIWLLLQVLSQQGRLLLRLDALETAVSRAAESQHWRKENEPPRIGHDSVEYPSVGSVAPAFSLPDVEGETVTLEGLLGRGRPIVLAFTDPACGPCSELWPDVARWQREQEDGATFVVVSRGTVDSNRTRMVGHALTDVLLQVDFEVASSYGVLGTPSAVLVHPDGKIGGPVAGGLEAIRNLVRDALGYTYRVRDATESQGITGSVDGMVLTDLSGRLVRLSEEIRQETLLVFWHPKCHYCGAMLEDLRQWEKGRSARHPRVIIISGGTLEENSGIELESLVLLDENFSVGRALGARGTPSAVVVDATGKAVSAVGTGAVGVWSLAGVVREGIEAVRV